LLKIRYFKYYFIHQILALTVFDSFNLFDLKICIFLGGNNLWACMYKGMQFFFNFKIKSFINIIFIFFLKFETNNIKILLTTPDNK